MKSTLPKAVRDLSRELTRLPGIGPKTAQRLSIHFLRQPAMVVEKLAQTLSSLHASVHTCSTCFNLSESETCLVCRDESRDRKQICLVEDPLDVDAIERTETYNGLYHVLGGVLSPIDGIGIEQLTVHELLERISNQGARELIIALDHNMESEATARHIMSYLQGRDISISRLAHGLPTGGDIEFADAMTLAAAFDGRKNIPR